MKNKAAFLILCAAISGTVCAQVYNPINGPYNPANSQYNPNNSQYNPSNSPNNPANSPYNPSGTNGVYDNNGNRLGYQVKSPTGVTNFYDNQRSIWNRKYEIHDEWGHYRSDSRRC